MATRPYVVVKVNQDLRSVWSRHTTLELARKAAQKYRRLNPDTDSWVDHYGYEIMHDGQCIEVVR